ncbi:helix-hairpin-helix domain-containing protein [Glaciecola sp. MH2013]|uniref:ComEA family DNA-binding protein n=1 Tax=Glaciecola sp. MH2013 TaxID=2785524 RepID=UPI00189D6B88|nr:helix-hairpin-helix domain-containing protein [Glaciecola sp. MH2013]MBF7072242.1 helix-hairpin-helix domain-containing protein [Glaciecola sp. MH2013]
MKNLQLLLASVALASACSMTPAIASFGYEDASSLNAETLNTVSKSLENKININTANADELTALPGIGQKKAEGIIEYRKLNGEFKTVDELVNVKGIGVKMVAKISDMVKV